MHIDPHQFRGHSSQFRAVYNFADLTVSDSRKKIVCGHSSDQTFDAAAIAGQTLHLTVLVQCVSAAWRLLRRGLRSLSNLAVRVTVVSSCLTVPATCITTGVLSNIVRNHASPSVLQPRICLLRPAITLLLVVAVLSPVSQLLMQKRYTDAHHSLSSHVQTTQTKQSVSFTV